jgi:ribosome-associated protein
MPTLLRKQSEGSLTDPTDRPVDVQSPAGPLIQQIPPERDLAEQLDLAKNAAEAAADRQASDVVVLDLQGMGGFADYFVICTGATERQRQAVAEAIETAAATAGRSKVSREGSATSGWLLLDLGGVIVHIFAPADRAFYQLERLWSRAAPVLRIQ